MMQKIARAQLKLMKYGVFLSITGGIASFIGEPHHGGLKALIGVVIGCAFLGKRLTRALKEMYDANQVIADRIEEFMKD